MKRIGVDFLAIAFGNAHGLYKGEPHLDLDLVDEIRRRVGVPLVMHGGTGLSDEQFRGAIAAGISKINFATSIMNSAAENMRKAASKPRPACSIFTKAFDLHIPIGVATSMKPMVQPDGFSMKKQEPGARPRLLSIQGEIFLAYQA